jgi:arylsulfatase A-like enzyme/lipopolysaccharide biosynthesis regulator YciM
MRKWMLALIVPAAALAAGGACARRSAPVNVLLVSIDTLRADRVGAYGYRPAQTPALDALARRGLRFANATSVGALTLPAHTSLLTGTFPAYHGVRDNGGFYVDDRHVTLAEILKARGYRTGGFVGAFVLDGRWGLNQGFDQYFDDFDLSTAGPGMDTIQRPGSEVVDRALAWLAENDGAHRPFFAWVHLYDPHAPYLAPPPFRARFPNTLDGAYDAEVAATDAEVGRLVDALDRDGRLDHSLIVVVGDHGESLGEHGEQAHGFFLYDAAVQVPLIIAGPAFGAGPAVAPRVVPDQVRLVDVMPTILERLQIPAPAEVQGRSLLPAARGERLDLLALAETWYPRYHYGWSELVAVRDGRYKFVRAPRRELYDLQNDPGERVNLAERYPQRADALERALDEMLDRVSRPDAARGPAPVDPEVEERLRALGYIGASVSRRTLTDRRRADPKDRIDLYNLLKQAGTDSVEKRLDSAIEKVSRALAADPEIVEAHAMLGNLYVKGGRANDAIAAYRRALSIDPEHQGATFSLALAYKNAGRAEEARAGFERAVALDPRNGRAQFQLGDLAMRRGDFRAAEATLRQALTLNVERPPFLVKLGECYIELKRWDEAKRALRAALAERGDLERAHYDLGLVLEARGDTAGAIAEYEAELARGASYSAAFNLGRLLSRTGRPQDAARRFREAVGGNPSFAPGHLYLAKALLDSGDLDAAQAAARRGLELRPAADVAPLGHYVLADVYSRLGRSRDAAREVARAQRLERQ